MNTHIKLFILKVGGMDVIGRKQTDKVVLQTVGKGRAGRVPVEEDLLEYLCDQTVLGLC